MPRPYQSTNFIENMSIQQQQVQKIITDTLNYFATWQSYFQTQAQLFAAWMEANLAYCRAQMSVFFAWALQCIQAGMQNALYYLQHFVNNFSTYAQQTFFWVGRQILRGAHLFMSIIRGVGQALQLLGQGLKAVAHALLDIIINIPWFLKTCWDLSLRFFSALYSG